MWAFLNKGGNDSAKGEQRLIDHSCFSGSFVGSTRTADSFRTSQIDQVEFTDLEQILAVCRDASLFDMHGD